MNLDWTVVDALPKFKGNMIVIALATIALHSLYYLLFSCFGVILRRNKRIGISNILYFIYKAPGNDTALCSYKSISFS